ncbi:MAG: N-6 DNA methylase [Anaerolineae bacterium]|nr:N-6 DNA methylase [Anaerolineae bacterium]
MSSYTPQQFVDSWRNTPLGERQGYQIHFLDVCRLIGHEPPRPEGVDTSGHIFTFEYGVKKDTGGQGFADVFYENHFAVEYKAPGKYKDLAEAYQQLLQYREKLNNPPLLVVTDIETWEIHTNWPNTEKRVYKFRHEDLAQRPSVLQQLRDLFEAPERLHPRRNTEQVTADAARVFQIIADNMRAWEAEPERIAHYLTKLVFCLFAEDVGLLPAGPKGDAGIFSEIIERTRTDPTRFVRYTQDLFQAMADGGDVLFQRIPWFNGSLFDDVTVEELSLEALTELERASRLNWESVEPAIFGTLFERSLDPSKRSQLGAHYTSREDILLIVEPVLMQPLRREWDAIQEEARPIREKYEAALLGSNRRLITTYGSQLDALRERMLHPLREVRVLDPACGSGNFLYISLQLLMDLEKEVIFSDLFTGMTQPIPEVHPRQMYGIEINPIAHALASIVVWIGYIQWRKNNGYYQSLREPILEELTGNIVQKDAILAFDADGSPVEPEWPEVEVIVSNPPFLGGSLIRGELGNEYYEILTRLFSGRLPGFADLVCYWFEKARSHIALGKAKRAGLLATNSIRGGANREVLKRIKESGDIFMAWADRPWVLEGAAVRVSMVGFDSKIQSERTLDGLLVETINSDLTASVDITTSIQLHENKDISFQGPSPKGSFDIPPELAYRMLEAVNPDGYNNADVVKRVINAADIVRTNRGYWTIDFGPHASETEAQKYLEPYAYLREHVYPVRQKNNRQAYKDRWWIYAEARVGMRIALEKVSRYISTPRVAKHRIFVWTQNDVMSNDAIIVFARDDDYFFGVLHSRLHEVWSLRMGTWLGVGNDPRYTPTTTFETFPFPWPPGQEDTASPAYQAIREAARRLHEERDAWLNPPGLSETALKTRTLTHLYNALNGWRGTESIRVTPEAADFAPRLDELHRALDRAVCDAYGWSDLGGEGYAFNIYTPEGEEEILRRVLALNLERAGE